MMKSEDTRIHTYIHACIRTYGIWRINGETLETFLVILKIADSNKLLLKLTWLKCYPIYALLSMIFHVSGTMVCEVINVCWPILWEDYASNVSWLSTVQWRLRMEYWNQIPHAVGAIDGTYDKIDRPTVIPQRPFYSGHIHFHCFHTVLIVDNIGSLCYIHSGFSGHINNALCFSNLPQTQILSFTGGSWIPFSVSPDDTILTTTDSAGSTTR